MRILIALLLFAAFGIAQAGPLEDRIARTPDGHWLRYTVPIVEGQGGPCCFEYRAGGKPVGKACPLDARSGSWGFSSGPDAPRANALDVYLRVEHGAVAALRSYGDTCAVDASRVTLETVDGVSERDSLALLAGLVRRPGPATPGDPLIAIALHAGAGATSVLSTFAGPEHRAELRRDAIFWLGHARGQAGFDRVRAVLATESNEGIRRHAVFALSQSEVPSRDATLVAIAREHASVGLRGEALFWLAQIDSPLAVGEIERALRVETSAEARDRAITALAQLPAERGTPALKALVMDKTLPRATRKQALFWLAQSDDEGAQHAADELFGALIR